jgi:hypothetical protein
MSRVRTPEEIQIASLRKKQQTVFDPMTPGAGTPWEDRATHGTVGAFFRTCFMSLTSPGKLTTAIRRPETTTDAKGFVIGCAAIWGLTALGNFAFAVWRETKLPDYDSMNNVNLIVLTLLTIVGSAGGIFFLFKIYNTIYGKLTAQEKDSVLLPDVLLYNVNAYALGPSLLAVIPIAGPPLALLWIFVDLIAVGNKRLRLRMPAAIIDALLSLLAVLAIAGAVYLVVHWLILGKLMDYDAVNHSPPLPEVGPGAAPR